MRQDRLGHRVRLGERRCLVQDLHLGVVGKGPNDDLEHADVRVCRLEQGVAYRVLQDAKTGIVDIRAERLCQKVAGFDPGREPGGERADR